MTRRHNRHFYLDDDLVRCSGTVQYKGYQCSNWAKPKAPGEEYWCNHHINQKDQPKGNDE